MPNSFSDSKKILVFDSGAGGLTVCKEILKQSPEVTQFFLADNARYPYGSMPDTELVQHLIAVLKDPIKNIHPDLVVLACNTASTIALSDLRRHFITPFVGVVPAIKPAALSTKTGVIGLLATPATVNRPYTSELIQQFSPDHQVILHGSQDLVALAESALDDPKIDLSSEARSTLLQALRALFKQEGTAQMDTIVLACTHFPILKPALHTLSLELGRKINFIDSGSAIARRVKSLLATQRLTSDIDNRLESGSERTDSYVVVKTQVELFFTEENAETRLCYESFLQRPG